MKTIGILSLGCPKNLVDSEALLAEYVKKGFKVIDEVGKADVAVVNTCAFIEDAKRESIDAILDLIELKKQGRIKKIIVAGCLPQRYEKALRKEMAEIDIFHGVRKFSNVDPDNRLLITPGHFAYVKISEGCDNRCGYCVISKIRGPYKSRKQEAVLKEIDALYRKSLALPGQAKGALKEINLISQDLTYYGMDLYGKFSLAGLLGKINKNIKWIRLLYAHPAHFTDELIYSIRDNAQICKYVDLPVQHINDKILARMGRKVTKKQILDLIAKLRKNIPDIAIRSSLIVGLPGETEKEFKELLEFIKDIKFERLGIFTYSREEGTPAHNYKGQVSDKEKKLRLDEAMKLQQDIARQVNAKFLGRTLQVLIDEKQSDGTYIGRTYADAPEVDGQVFIRNVGANPRLRREASGRSPLLKIGEFVDAKIVDTMEYDLVGEV